ncbi:ABC transporter ATP-binding protein [Kineococcus rhizosphaerae]|uniref:ABC-type quaternary amine transporter n=1 Tax=Kineococcus rhizosphaerae TaxID=559628 RepID=A0A2T0R261_9ACTN|nr:ABC transporter ATP-binding protein [Kineococcus rhizosphaerae]PRY13611.1 putative spermidine/putrescine transport system ATP-binding protein [Kineococcus rhizosphaerae]
MAELSVSGVSKTYHGNTALHPIDLEVPDGRFCAMLGSSGSGKSTLLRIVAGLEIPDGGSVRIGGRDVTRTPVERRNIGFVFQNYALFPHLSVRSNVTYGLRAKRVRGAEANRRAEEMLALVGLKGYGDRSPKQLSGGQQQRVALARALVTEPDLLLLDEPLSALDRKIRGDMQREIKRIHAETGLTTIMVTHDQEEAIDLGDEVLLLDQGRVQQNATPEAVYRSPQNPFVAQFLGAHPLGRGTVQVAGPHSRIVLGDLDLPNPRHELPAGTEVEVLVMSEKVRVFPAAQAGTSTGRLDRVDFFGPIARAEIDANGVRVPVTMLSQDADDLGAGDRVWFSVAPAGVHVFPVGTTAPAPVAARA